MEQNKKEVIIRNKKIIAIWMIFIILLTTMSSLSISGSKINELSNTLTPSINILTPINNSLVTKKITVRATITNTPEDFLCVSYYLIWNNVPCTKSEWTANNPTNNYKCEIDLTDEESIHIGTKIKIMAYIQNNNGVCIQDSNGDDICDSINVISTFNSAKSINPIRLFINKIFLQIPIFQRLLNF